MTLGNTMTHRIVADCPPCPAHDAYELTNGGNQARIVLDHQVYTLRITRAGKLILTK